jgi:hypothetical protein
VTERFDDRHDVMKAKAFGDERGKRTLQRRRYGNSSPQ